MTKYALGIDVSKATLDAVLVSSGSLRRRHYHVANTERGIHELISQIEVPLSELPVGIEPTGVYSGKVCRLLYEAKATVYIINPLQSKRYRELSLHAIKTDPNDAFVLGDYVLRHRDRLHTYAPATAEYEELDRLVRCRTDLVEDRIRMRNQLKVEQCTDRPSSFVIKLSTARIAAVQKNIAAIERQLRTLVKQHEALRKNMSCLLSIPGVGEVTAWIFLAVTKGHVESRGAKQWAAFAGVTVMKKESGTSVHTPPTMNKRGNGRVRSVVYMAALAAVRSNEYFKSKLTKLLQKGRRYKTALTHIMNLLVRAMVGVCLHGRLFDVKYFPSLQKIA